MRVSVNINTKNLNTQFRIDKAKLAASYLEQIINSSEFKAKIYNMPEKWRIGESSEFKYLENDEIYERIIFGLEEWNNEIDNEFDIIIDDYYRWYSKVIGYMIPGKPTIYVNTKFFDSMEIKYVVSNLLHEYFHTIGMRHSGENFKLSIPYYANEIVEEIFDDVVVKMPFNYEKVCSGFWIFTRCRMVKVNGY